MFYTDIIDFVFACDLTFSLSLQDWDALYSYIMMMTSHVTYMTSHHHHHMIGQP